MPAAPLLLLAAAPAFAEVTVADADALVAAVRVAGSGDTVRVAPGTHAPEAPLEPRAGVTLTGAGVGETVLTHTPDREPSTATLPDPEMRKEGLDSRPT